LIVGLSYGIVFLYVPWTLVVQDTYLWLGRLPEELVYFNKVRLGLDEPLRALAEMGMAAGMLLGSGCLIAAASLYWTQGRGATAADDVLREWYKTRVYALFILASVGVLAGFYFGQLPLDRSPYRATPLILAGLMVYLGRRTIAAWQRRQAPG